MSVGRSGSQTMKIYVQVTFVYQITFYDSFIISFLVIHPLNLEGIFSFLTPFPLLKMFVGFNGVIVFFFEGQWPIMDIYSVTIIFDLLEIQFSRCTNHNPGK